MLIYPDLRFETQRGGIFGLLRAKVRQREHLSVVG